MRRRTALSIALALSALVSLVSLPATAQTQQRQRFRADTGFVTLGPNQVLRVSALNAEAQDGSGTDNANFIVRRMQYGQVACSGGVCRHAVASQNTTNPIGLAPGEAVSMDIAPMPNSSGVRAVILSNRRNVRATAAILNTVTGETTSHIIMANTEGDF